MVLAGRLVSLLQVSRKSSVPGEAKGVATSLTPPELLGSVGNWIPPAKGVRRRSGARDRQTRQPLPRLGRFFGRRAGGRASLLAQAFQLWPAVLFLQPRSCCCC